MKKTLSYKTLAKILTESLKIDISEANVGNAFEEKLASRLSSASDGNISDKQALDMLNTIAKTTERVVVKHEGGLNQKRIIIRQDGYIVGPENIGPTVTDITLDTPSGSKYLSVKYGKTLKISNIGISNWFKDGSESCEKFFMNLLKNPKDAKSVAKSFIGWFKSNESNKNNEMVQIYDTCCKNDSSKKSSSINDFEKKCLDILKSQNKSNAIDNVFSDFLTLVDRNGKRNDMSRSMAATWLASINKDQYKKLFNRLPHNFQKHTAKFTTELNSLGFPQLEQSTFDNSENFEEYLFSKKHPVDEAGLKNFIATCIGYGYWMVHGNQD